MSTTDELIRRIRALESTVERLGTIDSRMQFLPMVNYAVLSSGMAASAFVCGAALPRSCRLLRFFFGANVVAPNDAGNYWTITLTAWPTNVAVATVNTSLATAGVWTYYTATPFGFDAAIATVWGVFVVTAIGAGAPGAISMLGSTVGIR